MAEFVYETLITLLPLLLPVLTFSLPMFPLSYHLPHHIAVRMYSESYRHKYD